MNVYWNLRGKNLPLKVIKSASSEDILTLAIAKHSVHNSNYVVKSSAGCYKLLYPDGSVVHQLRECNEEFTLNRYKLEIGKLYNRLLFYICTQCDFLGSSVEGLLDTDECTSDYDDDTDKDTSPPPKKVVIVETLLSAASGPSTSSTVSTKPSTAVKSVTASISNEKPMQIPSHYSIFCPTVSS